MTPKEREDLEAMAKAWNLGFDHDDPSWSDGRAQSAVELLSWLATHTESESEPAMDFCGCVVRCEPDLLREGERCVNGRKP